MTKYTQHSGVCTLKTVHEMPISLSEAWQFLRSKALAER